MTSAQGVFPILNPGTYLNHLTPSVARDYEISKSIGFAFLGILGWDILSSIPDDYRLICTGRISFVLFAYSLARLAAFIMQFLTVLLKAGPVSHCGVTSLVLAIFQIISTAAASYLFLKRVHAVYYGNKFVQHVFSFLWLVCVGTNCILLPRALQNYAEIAETKHCIRARSWSALPLAYTSPTFFDILVYLAITYKLLSTHGTKRAGNKRWVPFRFMKSLPHFSRAVLQGGQQYYLITSGINTARFAFSFLTTAPPIYQVILSTPAVVLTSIMACRVHRNLIIEALDDQPSDSLSSPQFAHGQVVTFPVSRNTGSGLVGVKYDDQIRNDGSRVAV